MMMKNIFLVFKIMIKFSAFKFEMQGLINNMKIIFIFFFLNQYKLFFYNYYFRNFSFNHHLYKIIIL